MKQDIPKPAFSGEEVVMLKGPSPTSEDPEGALDAYFSYLVKAWGDAGWTPIVSKTLASSEAEGASALVLDAHHALGNWTMSDGAGGFVSVPDDQWAGEIKAAINAGTLTSDVTVYNMGCYTSSQVNALAHIGIASVGYSGFLWVSGQGGYSETPAVTWPQQ